MRRSTTTAVLAFLLAAPVAAQDATPANTTPTQPAAAAQAQTPRYATVAKGRDVNVRTAASVEGGYPFFKVHEGDIVELVRERFGWSRIRMSTPVFDKAFGYVEVSGLKSDGTTGTVRRRTTFRAPNLQQAGRLNASWEGLDPALKTGSTVTILARVPGASEDDPGAWKVKMPRTQEAWINSAWLRPATANEIATLAPAPVKIVEAEAPAATTTEPAATTTEEETTVATVTTEEETVVTETPDEDQLRAERLAALDTAFRAMLQTNDDAAELELLQQQFTTFSTREDATELERETAKSRAEVLALKVRVQDRLRRLKTMRDRTRIDNENISATRLAMDSRAPYDIVGKLNASVIFTGKGTMPLLFRLQDAGGGQTIAYLIPDERYDIAAMTGLLVGIIGQSDYDEALQLNLITPRRIDLLSAQPKLTSRTNLAPAEKPKITKPEATPEASPAPAVEVQADNEDNDD